MNIDITVTIVSALGVEESVNLLDFILDINPQSLHPKHFFKIFGYEHERIVVKRDDYAASESIAYSGYAELHWGSHFVTLCKKQFVIYTGSGRIVPPEEIYNGLWDFWDKNPWSHPWWMGSSIHYWNPKRGGFSGYRRPKTLQALKQSYSIAEEGEPEMRGRRKQSGLPTSWDDVWRYNLRNWKKQSNNRKQWMADIKKKVNVDEHYDGISHW